MSPGPARRSAGADRRVPPPPSPGSTASLRSANQRRVLRLLQHRGGPSPLSQAEIARSTGLAPATVSNIVRDLSAAGVVETVVGSGRRGTTVRISRRAGLVAGIDIGHRHARVAVADLTGEILAQERAPLLPDHGHDEGLRLVQEMLRRLLKSLKAGPDALLAAGLGLPAPINSDDVVMSSAILPGWVGIDARAAAERSLGLRVHIDNDANLGALAEHHRGAGVGHDDMVFVKVSSGVGAGLILRGEPFRGAEGTAGEIGHLTLDEQGPLCRCGSRGCLEVYTSAATAETMIRQQLPGATIEDMVRAAAAGNVPASRIFEDAGLHLGWGIAMLANIVNPSAVVVGGDMARAGHIFLDSVRTGLRRHALPSVAAKTLVVEAALGERASAIGALLLALDRTELVPGADAG